MIENLVENYPYHAVKNAQTRFLGNGLLFFSKYPIISTHFYSLKNKGTLDEAIFAEKEILICEVNLGEETYIFVNLHLTSGGFFQKQDAEKVLKIRNKQINEALECIQKMNYDSKKVFIMGDFNAGREVANENYAHIKTHNYIDAYEKYCLEHNQNEGVTWDSTIFLNKKGTHHQSLSQRIDHLFLNENAAQSHQIAFADIVFTQPQFCIQEDEIHLSDHYGLLVEIAQKEKI